MNLMSYWGNAITMNANMTTIVKMNMTIKKENITMKMSKKKIVKKR